MSEAVSAGGEATPRRRSPLLPIFLIVLVDIIGYTMVLPLLPFYAQRFGADEFVATLLVSVYAFCSLIFSPILGALSDKFGRKPILLLSQAGTFTGFVVLALANSLPLVFLGRILDGLTAGNLSIAQAYISDNTEPQHRSKAFAVIGIAFGIGFMIGPAISGKLAAYGIHAPFIAASVLSALSMVCTVVFLPKESGKRTVTPDAAAAPAGRRPSAFAFATYAAYFRRPSVGLLLAQFFLFSYAFSCFTGGFSLFAQQRFGWGPTEVGYLFAFSGFLGIILQGGMMGRLVKRFGELKLALTGFAAAAAAYVVLGFATSLTMLIISALISAYGNGVLRPVITSLMTQAVGRDEQGTALGISQSLGSIAMMLAPPASGLLIKARQLHAWGLMAAGVALLGMVLAMRNRRGTPAAT